ncbi:hypothetical protein [Streptomyces fulvoviolaceus]|uniref:hypothetical protein n=1 Tax=Streptomyces fulvoviolaceus TaxID=285535 RepID=UPI0004C4E123|nr:hypothetical protein [Streptomyces fulvoviolaceus]
MDNGPGGQMAEQDPHKSRSAGRPGRKFSPVRADTEEYTALASFLRNRMHDAGMTVRGLAEAIDMSSSAVSERLAGAKLEAEFVTAVVEACTEEQELRPRRGRLLAEGAALLARAERRRTPVLDATQERNPVLRHVAVAAQQRLLELHDELHLKNAELEALNRVQHQSELALRDTASLSSVLSVWVTVLADEVEHLTRERELTMSVVPPDLARLRSVDAELARTVERHGRTRAGLDRTERDRRLAAALLAEAVTRTRDIRREVLPLQAALRLPGADGAAGTTQVAADIAPLGAYGDDVDAALDRAEAVSRTIADRLRSAVLDLDDDAETFPLSAADAVDAMDNADNGPTSTDATDNAPWWDMLGDVPTGAFTWAEETAVPLLAARDPHDPRFEQFVRDRRPREVMLLADRLLAHHWAEGSARLRTALALSLPPDELAPLVLALAKTPGPVPRAEQGAQMLLAAVLLRTPADVYALTRLLTASGDDLPRTVRWGVAAFARRPRADVVDYLRVQMPHDRMGSHTHVLGAVISEWPVDEVLALVDDLMVIEDGDENTQFGWMLLAAFPRPPFAQTELLLRLWTTLPRMYLGEMLPSLYQGDSYELADVIVSLHKEWPPPLDGAARELAAEVMPLIIRRESLEGLDVIADRLAKRQLSPERIFEPYRGLLSPNFMTPPTDET